MIIDGFAGMADYCLDKNKLINPAPLPKDSEELVPVPGGGSEDRPPERNDQAGDHRERAGQEARAFPHAYGAHTERLPDADQNSADSEGSLGHRGRGQPSGRQDSVTV